MRVIKSGVVKKNWPTNCKVLRKLCRWDFLDYQNIFDIPYTRCGAVCRIVISKDLVISNGGSASGRSQDALRAKFNLSSPRESRSRRCLDFRALAASAGATSGLPWRAEANGRWPRPEAALLGDAESCGTVHKLSTRTVDRRERTAAEFRPLPNVPLSRSRQCTRVPQR